MSKTRHKRKRCRPHERFQSHHDPSLLGFYMSLANVTAGLVGLMLYLYVHVPGPSLTLFMSCAMAAGIGYQASRLVDRLKIICWIAGMIGLMSAVLLFLGWYHILTLVGVFFCVWFAVRKPKYRLAGLMALFPAIFVLGTPPDWHTGVNAILQQFIVVPVAWFTVALLLWLPGRMRIRRALSLYASSLAGAFAALREGGTDGCRAAQDVPLDFMLMVDRLICEREYDFASVRSYAAASVDVLQTFHALSRVAALAARHSADGRMSDAWLGAIESKLDRIAECFRKREPIDPDLSDIDIPSLAEVDGDVRLLRLAEIARFELAKLDGLDLEAKAAALARSGADLRSNEQFIPNRAEPIILSYKRAYSTPEEYAAYDATKVAIVITAGVFLFQALRWPYGFFIPLTCIVVYIGAFLNGSIMLRAGDRMKGVVWGSPPAILFLATACYANYYFIYLIPLFWFLFMYSVPILKSFCWSTAILSVYIFSKIVITRGAYEDVSLFNLNLAFFWSTAVGLLLVVLGEWLLWPRLWKVDTHMYPLLRPVIVDLRRAVRLIGDVFLEGRSKDPDVWPALSYILNKLKLSAAVIQNMGNQESRSLELEGHCRNSMDALFECFHIVRSMSLLCQYNEQPVEGNAADYLTSIFRTIDFRLAELSLPDTTGGATPESDAHIAAEAPNILPRPPMDETGIVAEFADREEEFLPTIDRLRESVRVLVEAGRDGPKMRP